MLLQVLFLFINIFFWYIFYSVHIYFTLRTYNYHKNILKYSHNKKEMSKSIFKIKLTVQRNIQ